MSNFFVIIRKFLLYKKCTDDNTVVFSVIFLPSFPYIKVTNRRHDSPHVCAWCVCSANMHRPRNGIHASNAQGKGSPYSRGDAQRHRGTRCFSGRSSRWKSIDLWLRRLRVPINVITELLYVLPRSVYVYPERNFRLHHQDTCGVNYIIENVSKFNGIFCLVRNAISEYLNKMIKSVNYERINIQKI